MTKVGEDDAEPGEPGREGVGEFEAIASYFAPLTSEQAGAYALTDDAAWLSRDVLLDALGRDSGSGGLVLTSDTMISGVHFLPDDAADLVARKLLRVNYSDLAAMGAVPLGYLVAMALPKAEAGLLHDGDWMSAFAAGLALDQATFGGSLLGGDTTAGPGPLTLTITALGTVAGEAPLRRATARDGDLVWVSGTIGDSALGLRVLQGALSDISEEDAVFLADRYHLPRPRLDLGQALIGLATSAMDVSDGLVGDAGHIARVSGTDIVIEAQAVPLSGAARRQLDAWPDVRAIALTGGDDYELLFTSAPEDRDRVSAVAAKIGLPVTIIGHCVPPGDPPGVRVVDSTGLPVSLGTRGFRHF